MRKQGIEFKGIIRATSGQAPGEGAMEELINLRNDAGSLKPVRDKKTLIDNVYYDKIYLHRYSSTENYIGVAGNEVRWLGIDGVTKQIVCTCNSGDINITSTGSLIVVCCMDEQSLRVYNFKGTYYFAHYLSLPPAVRVGVTTESNPQQSAMVARAGALPSLRELTELCVSMLQECRLKEPKASEGYILVSANYTLLDGSETKMTPPKLIQLGSYNQAMQFAVPGTDTSKFYATVPCQKLKLTAITPGTLAAYRDIIRSVNLYCST
ncbi:MAG: hypothetical protein EOM68_07440, partial [Spirochaetia bacterium]|nr:hypothetical protein [Spirochaetia bacterium]